MTTANRIFTKYHEMGYIIVSSETRSLCTTPREADELRQKNDKNYRQLKALVREAGYGYVQAIGRHNGNDDLRCLIVPARSVEDSVVLSYEAIGWARKFEQKSIFVKSANKYGKHAMLIFVDSDHTQILSKVQHDNFRVGNTRLRKRPYEHWSWI